MSLPNRNSASLTRLAVNRPVTTLMLSLIIVIVGMTALTKLAVDLMPDVTWPTISITTVYEGAGPEEIETLITRPMEQAAGSVHGVEQIVSESQEGSSNVRVRFAWGTDIDSAIADIRARIERLRSTMPPQVQPSSIRRYDIADFPMMYLGLESNLDDIRQTQLAEKVITPQFENLPGVAAVRIRGATRREIHVDVDRSKLPDDMSITDVVDAIQKANSKRPSGDLKEGNLKLLVRVKGEFRTLDQIRNIKIRTVDNKSIFVRDVATVRDGKEEQTELTRVNGKPGLLLYINKQSGGNTVDISNRVHKRVAEINRTLPHANLTVRVDKADYIRESIDNVRWAVMLGMALASVVLLIFLRSVMSTVIIAVSMPLSVLATFILIYFKGFTLNMVSFGGLALGIGLLVDNSIVVLESIFRRREEGADPKTAAIEGTAEVSSAIIASTLTTLIVFLPLLFIQGMTGILLHQLTWVVSISLLCSLFVSLTLTPVMTAYLIPEGREAKWAITRRFRSLTGLIDTAGRRVFAGFEWCYRQVLRFSLRFAVPVGLCLFALFCYSIGNIPRVGTEYMPKTDEGGLRITGRMAPGIRLGQLQRQSERIERTILNSVDEARAVAVNIGGGPDDADDWNEVWFRMHLTPRSERKRSAAEIRKDLAERIGKVPGMKYEVRVQSDNSMSRMLSRRGSDLEVQIRGYDRKIAEQLANRVAKVMRTIPGLVNVQMADRDRRPELAGLIDRAKAGHMEVAVSDITQTLETTIRGTDATIFREDGNEHKVKVRLRENDRRRVRDIRNVGVKTKKGVRIPLNSVMDFDRDVAPVAISRLDKQRVIEVTADIGDRDMGSVVTDLQEELQGVPLPHGYTLNIAGQWEEQQKSFADLRIGFVLAVILMYMVMASQFESLRDPLIILVALPFGAVGVVWALLLTDTTLNVQSFIGIVMLAGIVVNNAIVLVDTANRIRQSSPELSAREVILRAGVRRFRPILMTTLTTVLAMFPIAMGWGEGGELQAPMARVVIGGLLAGTLMTLVAIPIICHAVQASGGRKPSET